MKAVEFAGLVGKYVRMERRATKEERDRGEGETIGMSALIAEVRDDGGFEDAVAIIGDYGMGFTVYPGENWDFKIYHAEPRS